jgi:hypothetical protein
MLAASITARARINHRFKNETIPKNVQHSFPKHKLQLAAALDSKGRGEAAVKGATRAVSRRGDADAGAVAQLVSLVQNIQAIKAET